MFVRRIVAVSLAITLAAPGGAAPSTGLPQMLYSRGSVDQQALIGEVLARHNVERRQVGVTPLAWDPVLADGARAYANELARMNRLRHSPKAVRPGQGENLWMGTRDYFRPTRMVADWASERSMFRAAQFPQVSTTGNWADVGHYTQIIWPGTKRVGCAISKAVRNDILVCRYWPAGNVVGARVP
jgi:hypothetical protein